MNYKDALYNNYVTNHTHHRKGSLDQKKLKKQSRAYRQHFGQFLPRDKAAAITDLGCGSGGLVWWLHQSGYVNAKGVDGSPEQVEVAKQLGIDGVILEDVFKYLDREKGQATLFARDLIEHFDKQSAFDFLRKCFTSLSSEGILIIQVPNGESPYFGRIRYGDFTHELAFSASSIYQLLSAVGFIEIKIRPWRPAITGLKSLIRYVAWRLIEPILKMPILIESGGHGRIVTMNLIAVALKPKSI